MKINKALALVRQLHPCAYDDNLLVQWLGELDGRIRTDIMETSGEVAPYDAETDSETELAAPFPHDGIYTHWLAAMIDYANQEYERYNNDMLMFNTKWDELTAWWMRTNESARGAQFVSSL